MPEPDEPTALYRLYDAEYDLLYIGISRDPSKRFKAHAHDKSWWHCVEYVDFTWFNSYPEARGAENRAHASERPPYNGLRWTGIKSPHPALEYDDSAERAIVRRLLLDALEAGLHAPGSHIWPFHISEACGYSSTTVYRAMDSMIHEGHLRLRCKTFAVTEKWADAFERRNAVANAA
ncbi:GIY-YIG nuclease family protein [Streptomyces sp. NPDC102406]|uniref:GIY-YIG nuclease family protein n=1 Tax=Streptomyces sp. NPDC102406 TaxID=3366171 RepID=UPI0038157B06